MFVKGHNLIGESGYRPLGGDVRGASPYSTGGGGTVLEHRYGAVLLTHLLTADPITELGDDVTPREISFQASAFSAVDDLVVSGYTADGTERRVSIGVRRDPSFVPSDKSTVDLIGSYLQAIDNYPLEVNAGEWRLALTVASPNTHVQQIRELASIARDVIDEARFRAAVARPGRTTQSVRERLTQFDKVVAAAATSVSIDTTDILSSELTWRLLSALRVRELRLEGVDETDRTLAVGRLRQITAAGTADAADKLFGRLSELVGRYAPAAATKNEFSLRRDLNGISLISPRGAAGTGAGEQAAITGSNASDIKVSAGPAVRSDYFSQVHRIAPEQLLDREQELAYLADFCTAPDSESYLWLRAEAWAGKSALLSSFVLLPPPGVRVVSFFVTARLAGQGDRVAFADVILEQVLELIGEPMPMLLTDATRDAHLLGSLARAARICQHRGERLVLVVDGLDEDQGATTGSDAHSIAAMLPAHPPTGMRVIVAGRPNPPVPADVPDDHPLRRAEIIRPLAPSPHAEVVRQDAERELKRLLHGTTAEQDLLGLLTAAGGGLSGTDLAELTGLSTWGIEDYLGTVSGRTFASRTGNWRPSSIVYVLGHEELQQQATRFLGSSRLQSYRDRLHAWAKGYRDRNWPTETPEYLLRGYYKLLHSMGDDARMLMCATDPKRHDRMLDIIGGDTAALAEITSTQEAIASQAVPDVLAMSRLAVHRARLAERNDNIPANLPGVLVQLGLPSRAEALARSITDPSRQVQALAAVAREVAGGGDLRRAAILSNQAEGTVPSINDPYRQAHALAAVARGVAVAGDLRRAGILAGRAEALARSLTDPRRAQALVAVARATASSGDARRAKSIALSISTWSERVQALVGVATEAANGGDWRAGRGIALSISNRSGRAQALAAVAQAVSAAGDRRRSLEIIKEAESVAHSIRNAGRQAWILVAIARAIASVGNRRKAVAILGSAERLASSATSSRDREKALISIARVTAIAGDPDRAEMLTRNIANPYRQARALAAVASGLATGGSQHRAEVIAREAEAIARSIAAPSYEAKALATLSQALTAAGDIERAEAVARSISDISQRERALTVVAQAMATTEDFDQAERIATSIADPSQRAKALLLIVEAAVTSGDFERAERIAYSIDDASRRARALTVLSHVGTNAKDAGQEQMTVGSIANTFSQPEAITRSVEKYLGSGDLDRAEATARLISQPYLQAKALTSVAQAAVAAGDSGQAEKTITCIANLQLRAKALASLSDTIATEGDLVRARKLVNQAILVANSISSPHQRDRTAVVIAEQLARAGDLDRGEKLARSIANLSLRAKALSAIALAVAKIGKIDRAEELALSIPDSSRQAKALSAIVQVGVSFDDLHKAEMIARSITEPISQAQALSAITRAFADLGQMKRAETIARSISDFSQQAQTLTALAADLAPSEAKRLLAYALMVGHWQICLAGLVRIEPRVVGVIAEEFLHATGQADLPIVWEQAAPGAAQPGDDRMEPPGSRPGHEPSW
jgi:tetratricopeptide (TPR) repeat protein